MTKKNLVHFNVIMPKENKIVLQKLLDDLGITRSKGVREILIAFSEGRCKIDPPQYASDLANLYNHEGVKKWVMKNE